MVVGVPEKGMEGSTTSRSRRCRSVTYRSSNIFRTNNLDRMQINKTKTLTVVKE
jgi:hypothetical protein